MLAKIASLFRTRPTVKLDEFNTIERLFIEQFAEFTIINAGDQVPDIALPAVGFLGRNPETGRLPRTIFGRFGNQRERKPYRIISFYTEDNEYAEHAARLRATLDRFSLDYILDPIPSTGCWERNCAYKAEFIYKQWQQSSIPVVWLDADATLEQNPELFASLNADFAIHKWTWDYAHHAAGWEFCSGTLYFGKSERAEALLKQWILRCKADPYTWDQVHLCSAWCDVSTTSPLQTAWLPRPYLQIDGAPDTESTVVKHWQASRKLRTEGKISEHKPLEITEAGKNDRQSNRLWRTPEESFWIQEGVLHIIPDVGFEFPEGSDIESMLREAAMGHFPILEIGCGAGRIASLFQPAEYIGVDVNPVSLIQARTTLPNHYFRIFDQGYQYPEAPTVLFYNVLLYISDDNIRTVLGQASQSRKRLIIAELMNRRWHIKDTPPVFNRDPEDYILMMHKLGFHLSTFSKKEYEQYGKEPCNVSRDSSLIILTFDAN
jgi:hypothetical protein